ncbi:TetR/AcrR family transcriptional regulator [Glaciibacter flavus]|uniref:TetR/AcrR family transcriptional regulator n=1 Tax=Orlajensenia flava TaxID=2565934 RepID=A0A4S4FWT2_9MICO|nr:TetR/AcrR family transcriptional regulator [Glaciibacter flavus]THG34415.1 TetR/AcrR family transcriptional regulator [Glaciibacter flavus]
MAEERRTRLSPDERRAQLVALGVAALADRPLDELSLDDLAAQAGVSRGLLFYYFESKQGFHREVVRTARDAMLRATEPATDLPPLERLHDTLERIVRFVREHRGTFFSLVRGAASGDLRVQEVVEQARSLQTERIVTVLGEMGVAESPTLRMALRSWVAFAEQYLVEAAVGTEVSEDDVVALLERTALLVVTAADPESAPLLPA